MITLTFMSFTNDASKEVFLDLLQCSEEQITVDLGLMLWSNVDWKAHQSSISTQAWFALLLDFSVHDDGPSVTEI